MTRVLIVDDRRRVRESLRTMLVGVPGVSHVGTVDGAEELFERYAHERPNVVLIGSQRAVATGVETVRRLLSSDPRAAVLVFGAPDDAPGVSAAVACGARGYLRWDATAAELTLGMAHAGLDAETPGPRGRATNRAAVPLTEREQQVLLGMSQGKSNAAIGRDLQLSEDTVKTHARRLFKKLGVNDRAQSVAIGFRLGLLS
ncbi:response regulator transcription factor [soil metagenome]